MSKLGPLTARQERALADIATGPKRWRYHQNKTLDGLTLRRLIECPMGDDGQIDGRSVILTEAGKEKLAEIEARPDWLPRLTTAQQELYDHVERMKVVPIRGRQMVPAEKLKKLGLIEIRIGGSGIAFHGKWWHEAHLVEKPYAA